MQVADLREQFKGRGDLAEAVHVLHHGKHSTTYIATAKSTGLKVLLKAYDIGRLVMSKAHSFSAQLTHKPASCIHVSRLCILSGCGVRAAASGLATLLPLVRLSEASVLYGLSLAPRHPLQVQSLPLMSCTHSRAPVRSGASACRQDG